MTDLNANDAEYNDPVTDLELRKAEAALGQSFPAAWRDHIQSGAWFRRGWMKTGAYVWLYTLPEIVDWMRAWSADPADRPGMIVIGSNGAGELLTIDSRNPNGRVTATPAVSSGWDDSIEQVASVASFIAAVNERSFEFRFERAEPR